MDVIEAFFTKSLLLILPSGTAFFSGRLTMPLLRRRSLGILPSRPIPLLVVNPHLQFATGIPMDSPREAFRPYKIDCGLVFWNYLSSP